MGKVAANHGRSLAQIPVQVALGGGVAEVGQCFVGFGQQLAKAVEQVGGLGVDVGEEGAGDEVDEAGEVAIAVVVGYGQHDFAAGAGVEAVRMGSGVVGREVEHGLGLEVENGRFFLRISNLQHHLLVGADGNQKVLVAFAGKLADGAADVEMGLGNVGGLGFAEMGAGLVEVGHGFVNRRGHKGRKVLSFLCGSLCPLRFISSRC